MKYAAMTMTGRFVVIEGIDRSGKTTICRMVKDKLENINKENNNNKNYPFNKEYICTDVEVISFPNRKSITGEIIDKYLTNKINLSAQTIHLLFSANRWEMVGKIEERRDKIILCDRYFYSGIAYTAAKDIDLDWCRNPDNGLPKPDLVIFIDLKPEEASKRPGFGTEKYEKIGYLKSVYKTLKNLVEEDKNGVVVEGNCTLENIVDKIVAKIVDIY